MKKLYSIYDSVANEFAQPFMANNDDCAKRMIFNSFSKNDAFHSSDYTLYYVGSYDIETGKIISSVDYICLVADIFIKEEQESNEIQ